MRSIISGTFAIGILLSVYSYTYGLPQVNDAGIEKNNTDPVSVGEPAARKSTKPTSNTFVTTTFVKHIPYVDSVKAIGTTAAERSTTVKSEISGMVVEAALSSNGDVKQNDLLVRLDDREQVIAVQKAESQLRQASELLSRNHRLGDAISAAVIDELAATVALANAELSLAELELEKRSIKAPISGTLGLSTLEVGDFLSTGVDVVTLEDTSSMLVDFNLPERSVAMLQANPEFRFKVPAFPGLEFDGHLLSFDNRIDEVTRTIAVRARINDIQHQLLSGMTVQVELVHSSEPLAQLPSSAITISEQGAAVWVVNENKAQEMPVNIVHREGEMVWLSDDLNSETQIIVEGTHKVRQGMQVADITRIDESPYVRVASVGGE